VLIEGLGDPENAWNTRGWVRANWIDHALEAEMLGWKGEIQDLMEDFLRQVEEAGSIIGSSGSHQAQSRRKV